MSGLANQQAINSLTAGRAEKKEEEEEGGGGGYDSLSLLLLLLLSFFSSPTHLPTRVSLPFTCYSPDNQCMYLYLPPPLYAIANK